MERLSPIVRATAIEIAKALFVEGHDGGFCIRASIACAHEWVRQRGLE
jgi:uncharacterized protein YdaT